MKYYIREDSNPGRKTYGKPLSLHRMGMEGGTLILERFDFAKKQWVDNPQLLDVTGIGGAVDYKEVPSAVAQGLMQTMPQPGE